MANNQPGFLIILKNLAQTYLKRAHDLKKLATLEAQLATKTVFSLIFIVIILGALGFSFWLCILLFLFVFLLWLGYSSLLAASVLTLINFVMITAIYLYSIRIKKNLYFSATRRQLSKFNEE